ncbi:MAG TPA: 16S rRNA (guanine(527)-N(7))-methyltransferase RsmG [Candidatus Acidoferrales bacterium]|nr:16S rRNA (guanine(527)-N(7))-methyltransferase RsmG [Candidatus Acidoferrales bacterium]
MDKLTDDAISEELRSYGVETTADICSAIRAYITLILHWNKRMSLTTVTDPTKILRFHFGECMFATSALTNRNGRLADVGSGAGFPGIPLKLVVSTLDLVLIESNAKKAAFLAEVVRELNISDADIRRERFEEIKGPSAGFDYIAARALGMHSKLLKWSRSAINIDGRLILWLGKDDSSLVSKEASWEWRKAIPIPGSHSRELLVGVLPRTEMCST